MNKTNTLMPFCDLYLPQSFLMNGQRTVCKNKAIREVFAHCIIPESDVNRFLVELLLAYKVLGCVFCFVNHFYVRFCL